MHILEILTTDKNTIQMALNSGFKDFEDALQSFSAENSVLGVITPESYVKLRASC